MFSVLIVDDDDGIREAVAEILLDEFDVDVYSAANGSEGQRMISERSFDVLLVDRMMPVMDGDRLLSWIISQKLQIERVIVMSASSPRLPPMVGFLSKPFSVDELIAAVLCVLGSS